MDLKSALECVKSQISTSNNSTYKKKKDNIFSSTDKDKKKAKSELYFQPEPTAKEKQAQANFQAASALYDQVMSFKTELDAKSEYFKSKEYDNEDEFFEELKEYVISTQNKLKTFTKVRGVSSSLRRVQTECQSFLDGIEDRLVEPQDVEFTSMKEFVEKTIASYNVFYRKAKGLTNEDVDASKLNIFLNNLKEDAVHTEYAQAAKLVSLKLPEEAAQPEEKDTYLYTRENSRVMPIAIFSAAQLKSKFKADSEIGYPVLMNQLLLCVSNKVAKYIDIKKEVAAYSKQTGIKYVLVAPFAAFKDNFYHYWVMSDEDLYKLQTCTVYYDSMKLKNWSIL